MCFLFGADDLSLFVIYFFSLKGMFLAFFFRFENEKIVLSFSFVHNEPIRSAQKYDLDEGEKPLTRKQQTI